MPVILALVRENPAGVPALRSCSSALFVWSLWFFPFVWLSGRSGFFGPLIGKHQTRETNQRDTLVCLVYLVNLVYLVCLVGLVT